MSPARKPIIKEMPKEMSNAAGPSLVKGAPTKTQGVTRALNERVSRAGIGIIQGLSKDTTNNVGQGIIKETPIFMANDEGYKTNYEIQTATRHRIISNIPKDIPNSAAQIIIRDIPKGTSNGVEQSHIKGRQSGTNNVKKPSIISGKARDSLSCAGERISNVNSNCSRERTPGDTGTGEKMSRGTARDAFNGTGSHITATKLQNGSHKIGSKRLGKSNKELTPKGVRPGLWTIVAPTFLGALCFARSLMGEFVHDDVWAILNNPDSRGETHLSKIFMNDFWGKAMSDNTSHKSYRPLCVLTFRLLQYSLGEMYKRDHAARFQRRQKSLKANEMSLINPIGFHVDC